MGRGKPPAERIPMTKLQFAILEQESRKRTIQNQLGTRIHLLLRASQGQSINQVAREMALSVNTVKSWRHRWQSSYESLCAYENTMQEQGLSRQDYLQELLSHLRDLPRSGTPKRITLEEEQQIVALSTEKPKDYGVEISDWTHEMLATVAIAKGIVAKISSRHVGNILKKANFNPISPSTGSFPRSKTGQHSLDR